MKAYPEKFERPEIREKSRIFCQKGWDTDRDEK